MKTNQLKVSVITVCRNEVATIEETIQSVIQQDYLNKEYIMVDGGSSDGTLDIINRYKSKIDKIVSESDRGIYDAMNKGLSLASGDIVIFLNANDSFFDPSVISKVAELFEKLKSDIIYGNAMTKGKSQNSDRLLRFDKVNSWFLLRNTICHQAIFAHKKLYDQIGKFDLKYKIAADYEWLLRAIIKHKAKASYFDIVVCNYSLDGISNDPESRRKTLEEYEEISKKYFSSLLILINKSYTYLISCGYKFYSIFKKKDK